MKSNVILKSTDRILFGVTIHQSTKDQLFSVSDLQKAYETGRWQHGWSDRRINDILQYVPVQERLFYLLHEKGSIKTTLPAFMEMVKKEGIVKVLKGVGLWKATGRGENKMVMCDPYVWVLLAMELNPIIYAKVVMWLTDTLIYDRIDAGNEFMPMNSAIKEVVKSPDYPSFAKTINNKVFGRHQSGMRNLASAKELRKIADIEKFIIQAIKNKFITNEAQIIKAIENY